MKKKYSVDFFLKDPEFIRWVRDPQNGSTEFWQTFIEQNPESKREIQRAAEIIRSLKVKRDYPGQELKQEMLNSMVSRLSDASLTTRKTPLERVLRMTLRYAALLVISAGIIFSIYHLIYLRETSTSTSSTVSEVFVKESSLGMKIQTKLPDGSTVWMNSGSKLEYIEDTVSQTRKVKLDGEAFFDVVKDQSRPFIVTTGEISVKALGTSFNVHAYRSASVLEVSLLTGKVLVSSQVDSLATLELLPGEKAVVNDSNREFSKQKFDYIQDIAWKEGILTFQNADFALVKEKLERWYGVTISVSDERFFSDWKVDGQFEKESLEMVLKHISYTKNFNFKIEGKQVYLTKK